MTDWPPVSLCVTCRSAVAYGKHVVCSLDGRRLEKHAKAKYCPLSPPRYGDGIEPADWAGVPVYDPADAPPPITVSGKPRKIEPVPRGDWPLCIKAVAVLAKPEDKGVGDTAHRVLSHLGGDAMAKLYEQATGKPCGCADRANRLNQLYPYG